MLATNITEQDSIEEKLRTAFKMYDRDSSGEEIQAIIIFFDLLLDYKEWVKFKFLKKYWPKLIA